MFHLNENSINQVNTFYKRIDEVHNYLLMIITNSFKNLMIHD